jgi:FlaA1/EpsC-like NDP-sugar epimerase
MLPRRSTDTLRELSAQLGRAVNRLPRWIFTRWGLIAIDASVSMVATWLAWQLRFDFNVPHNYLITMRISEVAVMVFRPTCLWALGAYRTIWRYFNLSDAFTFCLAAVPPTLLMFLVRIGWLYSNPRLVLPLTVIFVDYVLFLVAGVTLRSLRRYLFEASLDFSSSSSKRTVLIGTAEGLASALRQISFHPEIQVVRLFSADTKLHGNRLGGFYITDVPQYLAKCLVSEQIDLVLIADADSDSIASAVTSAMECGVEMRLLPLADQVIRGDLRIAVKPSPESAFSSNVKIAPQPHEAVVATFRGRSVLVTGAGGSIGSELSRQVSRLPVRQLVLLDQDENAIFSISGELSSAAHTQLIPIVGDIRDRDRMNWIFSQHRPDVVLHAAAYKHVPIMEQNCSEAILNNVLGTRNLAEAAINYQAECFLMISTDKAVNPSCVMGATKRIAELTVQHFASRQSQGSLTRCACVRFGNVVGSNGSVVPIFLRQIAAGGPVTITHEEMTRYFMTIPSAVQLVLQATTLGSNGEIYMLDMGDPVKITSLARRLIEMSGLRPGHDINIQFVGVRPGEKLHEQLWSDSATVKPTSFPSVLRVDPSPPPANFEQELAALETIALTRNDEWAYAKLIENPIGYEQQMLQVASA